MTNMLAEFWTPPVEQLWMFSPELALIAGIAALLVVPLLAGRNPYLTAAVALCGVLATLVLTGRVGQLIGLVHPDGFAGLAPVGQAPMLIADYFGVFFKLFLMLFLALVIGLWLIGLQSAVQTPSNRDLATVRHAPEFFVLLMASALGMILMVSTLNLLMIVLAIEMTSLPSYAIAGFEKNRRRSAEASLKYVLFGAATAAIMLYGVSLLYGYYGTLDLAVIADKASVAAGGSLAAKGILAVGFFALCVGIAFKISAVPFHFWCPDVFEGAPIEVTTWLSVASKAAGLGLLMRVVMTMASPNAAFWAPMGMVVGVFAVLTCTVANFAAYRQDNVKRILAYSSIAHAGYMLMAAAVILPHGAGDLGVSPLSAVLSYLLVYLFMNLGAFGVTAIVSWQTGSESLSVFKGLGWRAPMLAVPMAVCLFSLVGLPPFGGFLAKWWLLFALGNGAQYQSWLWGLVIVLVLNTLFSLYYYVRIILYMFLKTSSDRSRLVSPVGAVMLVNACAIALLYAGTFGVKPIKSLADAYAARIYTGSGTVIPTYQIRTVHVDAAGMRGQTP